MLRMAPKMTFGIDFTDTFEGINFERMRQERAAKAKQVLKRHGVPAILVTGEPNVRYLTGYSWSEFQPFLAYTLFFAEHDPIIFAHAGSYHQMPDQAPWIKEWRIARAWLQGICGPEAAQEEANLFAREIFQEIKNKGLAKEQLGIVGFDYLAREALKRQNIALVEGSHLLLEASKTKTQDEVNCLMLAASFCTSGWQRALEVMKSGTERDWVRRQIVGAISEAGATFANAGILSGPMGFERNLSYRNRRIEYGDLVYIPLCGTSYLGYPACLYRTFVVGRKPTAEEKDWFKQVKERLDACIEATRIGASTADIAKAFPPASKWGYKDEVEVLTVECGHGIGLVGLAQSHMHYNYPIINRQWSMKYPQIIEEGMVIAYESLEGKHRIGGVRMENMVVVTKNGAEIMDFFPRDEILVSGEI